MKNAINLVIVAIILAGQIACDVNDTSTRRPLFQDSLYVMDSEMKDDFVSFVTLKNHDRYMPWPDNINDYHMIWVGGQFFKDRRAFQIIGVRDTMLKVEGNISLTSGDTVLIREPNYNY